MTDEFEFSDELDEPAPRPIAPGRRRARARMGAVIGAMGTRATARTTSNPEKAVAAREHADKAKRLLTGGKSKGEALGYGVAKAVVDKIGVPDEASSTEAG